MSQIKDRTGLITSTGVKVISLARVEKGEAYWNCECPVCHRLWAVRGSHLNEPNPSSMCKNCSSLKNLKAIEKPFFKDLTGQKFGKLTVLYRTNRKNRTYFWKCKCDCGAICEKEAQYLLNGDIKSCGCLRSEGENQIASLLKNHNICVFSI